MLRVGLFLLTNFAVLAVAGVTLNLLGVGRFLTAEGLDLSSLLVFCAVGQYFIIILQLFQLIHADS